MLPYWGGVKCGGHPPLRGDSGSSNNGGRSGCVRLPRCTGASVANGGKLGTPDGRLEADQHTGSRPMRQTHRHSSLRLSENRGAARAL